MNRHTFVRLALAAVASVCCANVLAQAKPQLIRFVVPYPAGGAADQISRIVIHEAAVFLDTAVVIENKAGAAGMIAAEQVLRAEPDGATFFVGANAPMVINQAIYTKMPYDPRTDFVPVSGMGKAPLLLVTRKDLGATTVQALIELGKKAPGKLSMGSASSGNITHLAGEYAASRMGFKVTHVPFAGSAPAIASMMGKNVDIMFDALPSCMQQAIGGRIVPLAIMDSQRFPALPNIPTMAELGFKGLEASAWFGVLARTGTPVASIEAMNKAINDALKKPDVVEKLRNIGAQPMPGTPTEFGEFIAAERRQWLPVARDLNVKAD